MAHWHLAHELEQVPTAEPVAEQVTALAMQSLVANQRMAGTAILGEQRPPAG